MPRVVALYQTAFSSALGRLDPLRLAKPLRRTNSAVDAVDVLGLDDKIGSIETGKYADFAVLDEDPPLCTGRPTCGRDHAQAIRAVSKLRRTA